MKNNVRSRIGIPYCVFMVLFVVLPVLIILYYAFTNGQGQFTLSNFKLFFTDSRTVLTLLYSLFIALITTAVCLLIAYPTAYILAKGGFPRRGTLLLLFIMPMWINFTLRITALKEVLTLIENNLAYYPTINTVLGLTYDFLPFMILPIYNVIENIDDYYIEAARDLGSDSFSVFSRTRT